MIRQRWINRVRWSWRRRILTLMLVVLALLAVLIGLLTDGSPLVGKPLPPTADQVGAARAAVRQFRTGQARAGNAMVRFDTAQLNAIGGLASNAFDPDRLRVEARGGKATMAGSHRLPLWRWLNVTVTSRGGGTGFPPAVVKVGSVTFSERVSRWLFETAREFAILRGAKLPPLDRLVRRVTVRGSTVTGFVSLPSGSGMVSQVGGEGARPDPGQVRDAYCRLVKLQTDEPSDDFSTHLRRAFAVDRGTGPVASSNRAAFVALAMLTVDRRVGNLAGLETEKAARCGMEPVATLLNGRADLPKHWALSAAFAATTGSQFSQAIGEWKELADSISRQSQFAVGDPSGFSFLDLAADRSGFLTAGLAGTPATAGTVAARLAKAEPHDLLPPSLMKLVDGMTNAAFVRQYGDTRDPRFLAAMAGIDAELRRSAVERSGPLATLPVP